MNHVPTARHVKLRVNLIQGMIFLNLLSPSGAVLLMAQLVILFIIINRFVFHLRRTRHYRLQVLYHPSSRSYRLKVQSIEAVLLVVHDSFPSNLYYQLIVCARPLGLVKGTHTIGFLGSHIEHDILLSRCFSSFASATIFGPHSINI